MQQVGSPIKARCPPYSPVRSPHRQRTPRPMTCRASAAAPSWPWLSARQWQRPLLAGMAAAALSAAPLAVWQLPAHAESVYEGLARVVDGDTLEVKDDLSHTSVRVRLFGIDAPESAQSCQTEAGSDYPCGQRATEAMKQLVGSHPVRCVSKTQDLYGRQVATCSLSDTGVEVNQWAVSTGNAVAYRQYSKRYIPFEEEAKAQKRGVWQGTLEEPAQWRKEHKRTGPPSSDKTPGGASARDPTVPPLEPPPKRPAEMLVASLPAITPAPSLSQECRIKGNINAQGVKIYHMPGSASYEKTLITPADGERFFCSEAEAVNAGWRPVASHRN